MKRRRYTRRTRDETGSGGLVRAPFAPAASATPPHPSGFLIDIVRTVMSTLALLAALVASTAGAATPAASQASKPQPTTTTAAATAATAATVVIEPRAFGHVLGDVLRQRILLGTGNDAQPAALPSTGRIDLWFERRPPRVETGTDGRRWLVLDYQVANAPRTLTTASLPALTLNLRAGAPLRVDAWPVSIGPLTAESIAGEGDLQPMRPDRLAPPAQSAQVGRRLGISLVALVAVLLAWASWWYARNRREAARLPFARAWRELAHANADDPAAWRRLHRALDEAAGRVVRRGALAPLFTRAPWLEPLHAQLEQFYEASSARFFVADGAAAPYPLKQLAHELYAVERRRQR